MYSFTREDLDRWERRLGRSLANGAFGENLTTEGIDVNHALIGERWRVGEDLELQVTFGRIPCATFRGWIDEIGWLKEFTADARPGAYTRVLVPGEVRAGDQLEVISRPDHEVTIALGFQAVTTHREYLPRLRPAWEFLDPEIHWRIARGQGYELDG